MSILPNFRLDDLMTIYEIDELRSIKLHSKNDQIAELDNVKIIQMRPTDFLNKYSTWCRQIGDFFSCSAELARLNASEHFNEIYHYCIDLNNHFKKNFIYTLNTKKHLEHWASILSDSNGIDYLTLITPQKLSAISEEISHLNGNNIQSLISKFYLHQKFVERKIASYSLIQITPNLDMTEYQDPEVFAFKKILNIDNNEEQILWKIGNHRLPLIKLYRNIEDFLQDKTGYTPNSKGIYVDEMLAHMEMIKI